MVYIGAAARVLVDGSDFRARRILTYGGTERELQQSGNIDVAAVYLGTGSFRLRITRHRSSRPGLVAPAGAVATDFGRPPSPEWVTDAGLGAGRWLMRAQCPRRLVLQVRCLGESWSALVELLRQTIAADRYPLSPRIKMLTSILAKIEAPGEPSMAQTRKRRR
jgi:hypothetical protein